MINHMTIGALDLAAKAGGALAHMNIVPAALVPQQDTAPSDFRSAFEGLFANLVDSILRILGSGTTGQVMAVLAMVIGLGVAVAVGRYGYKATRQTVGLASRGAKAAYARLRAPAPEGADIAPSRGRELLKLAFIGCVAGLVGQLVSRL